MDMTVDQPVHSGAELRAVITRADGTVVDLGVVAASYRNPIRAAWWQLVGSRLAERRIQAANRTHARSA